MLKHAGEDFDVTDGTYVHTAGALFIFHLCGDLKEVWSSTEFYGGC